MKGRSQAVQLPEQFRFSVDEVYIRRDPGTGDVILSENLPNLVEIFETLDRAVFPDSFLSPLNRSKKADV